MPNLWLRIGTSWLLESGVGAIFLQWCSQWRDAYEPVDNLTPMQMQTPANYLHNKKEDRIE